MSNRLTTATATKVVRDPHIGKIVVNYTTHSDYGYVHIPEIPEIDFNSKKVFGGQFRPKGLTFEIKPRRFQGFDVVNPEGLRDALIRAYLAAPDIN